jgi:hypothetical protein
MLMVLTSTVQMNTADAQPLLNLKRVINNWPTIEVYFNVSCEGMPKYDLIKENFELYETTQSEQGYNYFTRRIDDFTLWCPDPDLRCMLSIGLVFDYSGSMRGGPLKAAIDAGRAFVAMFDGSVDEACIVGADTTVNVIRSMTTSKSSLDSAIASLVNDDSTDFRSTAVWDACYRALEEIINHGGNACRAVILMTDGEDTVSTSTPDDIILLAVRNRIRVFTIGLGNVFSPVLERIADNTGGRHHFTSTPVSDMPQIFSEVTAIIRQGFQECLITYQAQCMDGSKRIVDLLLKSICDSTGTDQKTKSYTAPRDTSTFGDLVIALGQAEAKAGREVTIPLNLNTPVDNEYFFPVNFTIQILDPSCGTRFVKLSTPPGSLLENVPITCAPHDSTVDFSISQTRLPNSSGKLADLTFITGDPLDTCCSEVKITSWSFVDGCYRPELMSGRICVLPRKPVVQCDITSPISLTWDGTASDYVPNPVTVTMRVMNTGDKPARNAQFRIECDQSDFALAGPLITVQPGNPLDADSSGGMTEARWDLRALPHDVATDAQVCIVASFDNHPDIDCCTSVSIPPNHVVSAASAPQPVFGLDVFPEPNDGRCTVCMKLDAPGDVELTVCDLLGRTVYTHHAYASSHELTHSIDLAGVPAGSYVLHAVSGKHSIMKMLVKEAR